MTGLGISLQIPGDMQTVRSMATWMDDSLRVGLAALKEGFSQAERDSSESWHGEAGDAFREALSRVQNEFAGIDDYVKRAASTLRAFAYRVENGRDGFAGSATRASQVGLLVSKGEFITFPINANSIMCSMAPLPEGSAVEQEQAAQKYQEMADTYDQIALAVEGWWIDQAQWNAENVVPLLEGISDLRSVDQQLQRLREQNGLILDAMIETTTQRHDKALQQMLQGSQKLAEDIAVVQKSIQSGNPAVSGPARKVDLGAARNSLREARLATSEIMQVGKFLKFGGPSIMLATAGLEIATGEDPGLVVTGVLAGSAAGAITATIATIVEAPLVISVAAVLGVSWLASEAARAIYTKSVEIDTREQIAVEVPRAIANSSTIPGSYMPRLFYP
ncbi:hypothetical protein [Mycetocola lacteus]|uniref:hypothetical protein n=1 Tax=Mycetocola lacteus TaxID=76637 RepID=UPI0011C3AB26|nr:hypothetical protein [Mycetocola lacteus]